MNSLQYAAQWLNTSVRIAQTHGFIIEEENALLNLSLLAVDMGQEAEALYFLQQCLNAQVVSACLRCRGCGQARWDAPMLTCDGCGVAKFCDKDHQRMASKKDHSLRKAVRHKDICSLLKKWRRVAKEKATAESCTPDLLEFLRSTLWKRRQAPITADTGARV